MNGICLGCTLRKHYFSGVGITQDPIGLRCTCGADLFVREYAESWRRRNLPATGPDWSPQDNALLQADAEARLIAEEMREAFENIGRQVERLFPATAYDTSMYHDGGCD